jgi:signal transduction histidine kinase/ActR/RegA family two-component response regulator
MRKDLEIGKTILLKRTYLDRILCCLFLVALLFVGNNASAASTPILLSDTALTPIQGYIDFLPNNDSINPAALLNGEFDTQFLRYDNKQAIISKAGIWLRFRITNSSNDENFIISAGDTHFTNFELLHKNTEGTMQKQQAGMLYPYIKKIWGFHDIAFSVSQPINSTRTYYVQFNVDFPLLMNAYVANSTNYAKYQVKQSAIGHLLVGIMVGIILYLTMISTYIRSLKEIYYCLGFASAAFIALIYGRGYIFSYLPYNIWLNHHLYALVYTTLTFTYNAFSRYYFKTQNHFLVVDAILKWIQRALAAFLIVSLFIPIDISIVIVQIMAFSMVIILCIISVYIWSNSERHLTAYVIGTLGFLFACILVATESNGLIDLGGITREMIEFALCFQAMLFALALAEKLNDFQHQQIQSSIDIATSEAENKAKNSFLAKMSHELRTPLNGILGMVQLLESSPLNDQQKHYTKVMHNSGRLLLGVIDDVLDYSRIVAGKLRIETVDFDLNNLLTDIEALFAELAREKNIQLNVILIHKNPPMLHGDVMRIRQILNNLLSNAIKFTASGSVTLRARIEQHADADWILHAEVEDTGCGIDSSKLPDLFQEHVKNNLSRNFGGSGLGLAICRQLIEMMSGAMHVESAPGYGSLFRFFIQVQPARNALFPLTATVETRHRNKPLSISVARILVVEDNEINREVIGGLLARLGLQAEFSVNGSDAVNKACQDHAHWDLILMDIEMPVMDGLSAAQHIRIWEAEQCRNATPIIALTAHAERGYEDTILQVGMDDYLIKPLDFNQMQNTLRKWLGPIIQATTQVKA